MMFTRTQTDSNTLECMGHCTGDYYKNSIDACCTPHSAECSTDEYESSPPTATSDRVCTPLTVCTAGQYQSKAPTANSNRECTALTACVGEYESQAPTATEDRVCTPHTVCTAEEYETREPTNKLDRVCAALTQCAAGQYESQAPTVNSDRVCTDLTECVSGVEYESQEPTDKSNRVCTAYSVVCDDDQYESQERTVNSDQECTDYSVNCSTEEYQVAGRTEFADRQCASLHECGPDEYQANEPAKNGDGVYIEDRTCTSLTVCNDAASGTLGTYANPEQTLTQTEVTETYSHYTTDRQCISWRDKCPTEYVHHSKTSGCSQTHVGEVEGSPSDCKTKCNEEETCNGFVYDRHADKCYLKEFALPMTNCQTNDRFDTYIHSPQYQDPDAPPTGERDRRCKDLTPKCPGTSTGVRTTFSRRAVSDRVAQT